MVFEQGDLSGVERVIRRYDFDFVPVVRLLQDGFGLANLTGDTARVLQHAEVNPVAGEIGGRFY